MKSGIVDLKILYKIAKRDKEGLALHASSDNGKNYGTEVTALCETIPMVQGFYLFGKYIKKVLWQSIYFGKAGTGKTTNLRARIREELSDERAFIWKGKHTGLEDEDNKDILAIIAKHYPQAKDPKKSRYETETKRAVRKEGTTHIVWVSMPDLNDDEEIKIIEADLIETLNPRANRQRNPRPATSLLDDTIEIIKKMKILINDNRPMRKK